jgi:rod shape-determining protein MreD
MANLLTLLVGVALLLLQGLVARHLPTEYLAPSLVLPMVLYMAVGEFSLERGVSLAFVLGYLTDAFLGSALGLWTFALVSIFLLARAGGLTLFLHGMVFQVLLTFVGSLTVGVIMTGLLLVFDRRPLAVLPAMGVVASQSLATAAVAPAVFALLARLPASAAPARAEET